MQNDSIDNLRLDLNKKSVRGVIYVRSGDTRARTIHITLTNNGSVVDLSDAHICEILIHKPDGTENDQAVVRYGNELQYTLRTTDINVPGECNCQMMVTFNDATVVTSPEFSIMVYTKTIDQSLEKSTNEYTAISQQVIEATNLRNQTAQDADRAETAREGVENYAEICKQYSEDASDSASNAATSEGNAAISADSASADKDLTKEYRDDAETFMKETRTNLAAVEDKATEILNYDSSAKQSAEDAADSATAAYNSEVAAASSAASVTGYKERAEAFAAGTIDGDPVSSDDPAYHNNAKYYSDQAAASAASFPTALSGFTNDCGFIDNTVNDLVNYYTSSQTYTQTEINNLIAAINEFNVEFVNALPVSDIDTHTIYFVARVTPELNDYYDEYINTDGTSAGWEHIGSTQVDLSQYYTKTEVDNIIAGLGSGHEIVDGSGTTLTQEDALQFPDSFISDDNVNGRTVVENVKEVASADYSSETEDGMYLIPDGEGAVIEPASDDKVEVVGDGYKTYRQLLNELFTLIDFDKIRDNSTLAFQMNGYTTTFCITYASATWYKFGRAASNSEIDYIDIQSSGSNFILTSLTSSSPYIDFTDVSAYAFDANAKITLYYGNKKATVDLQTTANRCWMADGTTVQSAIDNISTTNNAIKKTENFLSTHTSSATAYIAETDGYVYLNNQSGQSAKIQLYDSALTLGGAVGHFCLFVKKGCKMYLDGTATYAFFRSFN